MTKTISPEKGGLEEGLIQRPNSALKDPNKSVSSAVHRVGIFLRLAPDGSQNRKLRLAVILRNIPGGNS